MKDEETTICGVFISRIQGILKKSDRRAVCIYENKSKTRNGHKKSNRCPIPSSTPPLTLPILPKITVAAVSCSSIRWVTSSQINRWMAAAHLVIIIALKNGISSSPRSWGVWIGSISTQLLTATSPPSYLPLCSTAPAPSPLPSHSIPLSVFPPWIRRRRPPQILPYRRNPKIRNHHPPTRYARWT